ncbi:hypothetical protein ABH944_009082 [Caballeronia udeis]|uniref:Leucine-binding protein domain-containing protein n=1 Tax=Caballeronia udeis TaxID=1232866 RepID=A0ABW8N488_9BURK
MKLSIDGQPIKLQRVSVDDQGDPCIAVQVAQQLVDEHVVAVIGHFTSDTTLPASQIYAKAGILIILPAATNPNITRAGLSTVYRVMSTDAQKQPDYRPSRNNLRHPHDLLAAEMRVRAETGAAPYVVDAVGTQQTIGSLRGFTSV